MATGITDVLEPFTELVNERFDNWLKQQNQIPSPLVGKGQTTTPSPSTGEGQTITPSPLMGEGRGEGDNLQTNRFSPDQLAWLNKIKDQIAQNAEMTVDDFNFIPFNQEGGLLKARELFGKDLDNLLQELNGYLIA